MHAGSHSSDRCGRGTTGTSIGSSRSRDEDQATDRGKVTPYEAKDGQLVALEVERVRHDDPVERRQFERHPEVRDQRRDRDVREGFTEHPSLNPKGTAVPIDRVDGAARTEEVGKGERERSFTGPEVGPDLPAPEDSLLEQPDMVSMVHGTSLAHTGRSRGRPRRSAGTGVASWPSRASTGAVTAVYSGGRSTLAPTTPRQEWDAHRATPGAVCLDRHREPD
jgi:hypothetical protein